jgi:A/G-specific adenine glycosylase
MEFGVGNLELGAQMKTYTFSSFFANFEICMLPVAKRFFTAELMRWHGTMNTRSLPWKEEKDPYKIWLSEIILQQTRALQGLPYYLKFTETYPTVHDMADARDEEAFRLWQGLGYYNRCRNMLATARYISKELNGKFPDTYDDILNLKGIGPYTASAIASFAYGLPQAVVDGNVYRVLSRYFGIETATDSAEGKKHFQLLAGELLYKEDSAAYNQAIMDLGATVCMPANPLCDECPLQTKCVAYRQNMTGLLPVKGKKTEVKKRYFHYLLLHAGDKIWIQKRTGKDIWQNLHEPYLIEADKALDSQALSKHEAYLRLGSVTRFAQYEGSLSQRLTHRIIESHFFSIELANEITPSDAEGFWMTRKALSTLAFPKTLVSFLEKKSYF